MAFTDQNNNVFKIHYILFNHIKQVVQLSIEKEIKTRVDCQCKNECQCISTFMENNFNQNEINLRDNKQKNIFKEIDSLVSDYVDKNENKYPNNLDMFDFTFLFSFTRNLLNINPKDGWKDIKDLNEMRKDFTFGGCLDIVRNIRNFYFGHLNSYEIKSDDFEKIIQLFHEVIDRLPNIEKSIIKMTKENIKLAIEKTQEPINENKEFIKTLIETSSPNEQIDKLMEFGKKINLNFNKKNLTTDEIDFTQDKNYIQRNEQEIIDFFVRNSSSDSRNKMILCEMGGFGKTWMAQFVSKHLTDNFNFIIKWFNSKTIEDSFRRILLHDFQYELDSLKNKNIINLLNNELKRLIQNQNDVNILFIFDNVENDGKMKKYFNDLPKEIKVLITTRNKDLLDEISEAELIKLQSINKINSEDYLNKSTKLRRLFAENDVKDFVEKLMINDKVTPFKLNLAIKFLITNKQKQKEEILKELEENTTEIDYINLFINSLCQNSKLENFLLNLSLHDDNQFISFETINIIFKDISDEDINQNMIKLSEYGLFDEVRIKKEHGIRIHDLIIGTLRQYFNKKNDNLPNS